MERAALRFHRIACGLVAGILSTAGALSADGFVCLTSGGPEQRGAEAAPVSPGVGTGALRIRAWCGGRGALRHADAGPF